LSAGLDPALHDLWRRREAALRSPVLLVLWAIWERGAVLAVNKWGQVICRPAGSLSAAEKAALRQHPEEVKLLVELANADDVIPNFECRLM
jgi:hypothetical protein